MSNTFGRAYLDSFAGTLGPNGLRALLNLAGLGTLIDAPPPPTADRGFDPTVVANLVIALETIYGIRQAGGLAQRTGRALAGRVLKLYGVGRGIDRLTLRIAPLPGRLRIGLAALARVLSAESDQVAWVVDGPDALDFHVQNCPVCLGRETRRPVCQLTVGLLQEALVDFSRGAEYRVIQTECRAMGAGGCVFHIRKEPLA
jgi:predicted hydrocarbon binding protein